MSLGLKPKAEAVKPVEVVASLGLFGDVSRLRAFESFVFQNGSMMCHGGSRVEGFPTGLSGLEGFGDWRPLPFVGMGVLAFANSKDGLGLWTLGSGWGGS